MASLPEVPVHRVPSSGGVMLALHDLGGDGPPVLCCHPTGFLGMTWGPMAEGLADVAHAWAVDFRGHGSSTAPASGDHGWDGMADDVLAVVDALADRGATGLRGIGHSMGGTALLMAEERRPGTFTALWLYEPIVLPLARLPEAPAGQHPMAEVARRRRPRFPDRATAYANFSAKPPLDRLAPAALEAYVAHGLRDLPGGRAVELACAPETEARVFEASMGREAYAGLAAVACPVTVAVGGEASPPSLFGPAVVDALPHGRLERHDDLTHFGPMEDPATMARAARAALGL